MDNPAYPPVRMDQLVVNRTEHEGDFFALRILDVDFTDISLFAFASSLNATNNLNSRTYIYLLLSG